MDITAEALAEWLRTQDPNTEFSFTDNEDCVCARFLKARGHTRVSCSPISWSSAQDKGKITDTVQCALNDHKRDLPFPTTYGEVLSNLEFLS